ncbi:MAG: HAMP domain-containing protein, partial [candidate division KSB1 bacterium]|nr:HAMP domain-containing protein [candidate division KSB1 bacterium]
MELFIIWLSIVALFLTLYSIYIWRRSPEGFRFQARLTILFFLFILVPSVPLTLFVSALLTQSTQMLLLPGVEDSLEKSLETIRSLMEQKGEAFHQKYPGSINKTTLEKEGVDFWAQIQWKKDRPVVLSQVSCVPLVLQKRPHFSQEEFNNILIGDRKSSLFKMEDQGFLEVYRVVNDSVVSVVGYTVAQDILKAKEEITGTLRVYNSLALIKEQVVRGKVIWALATVFIIFLAVIAIYAARLFSRGISEPIKELTEGMKKIATGDLSHQVRVEAKDEIKFLVDSFNQMSRELKASREKLIRTERIAAWRDVARRVSHEIKNPLTPIQIALHRIRSKILPNVSDPQEVEESFRTIQEELQTLRRIADEFSQFARLPQPELKPEDLNDIIRSSVILFEAQPSPVKFKLNLSQDLPQLMLDREQIKRALNNLLKNSVEAMPSGGLIS